ncbi:stAR-related lipid transfer protein 7, mitochondrial-like [Uloborus diversus]|uniref:stAR-related lipid transfer protein 7, mitochondrial-like n=1 Tax=Uloborus diversus TaxID=327109 RepID=UPI002409291F|nr:stAR-related lipid transfer protein 7, mitochondrial-like [Uloborus diversus]
MNGSYVYNKIVRNFRSCYRSKIEGEISVELRRCFTQETSRKRSFSFKSVLEFDGRKKLWEDIKAECNERLILLGELFTTQCNFIASQRVRRMSQIWNLYSHLYTENSFREIVSQFAKNFRSQKRPFSLLLGAAFFSWEKEKITDEEIQNFSMMDLCLLDEMHTSQGGSTLCIYELDRYRSSDDHPTKPISGQNLVNKLVNEGWEAVIQKECVQVWRKAFPNSYLYEYKIMGTFYDVPARTFFSVQTDIEYRKEWDKLVIKLDVIDKEKTEGGCEVMHWVMHYPFPMYSREYVYIRRAVISPETNTMVLVSRAVEHPSCPVNNKYVRVTKYSSRMVIRPHRTYDENGFDYVLTYFDDPQAAFPAPAYNWMASSGVPDFVEKLHAAAQNLYCQEKKSKSSLQVKPVKEPCTSSDVEYIYM